jgi:hypothetical protein
MNENKEKREFAQQLEQIAETLTQAVKDNEGRAFILIGADVKDNKDGESENVQGVIAVGGNGGHVIKGWRISSPKNKPRRLLPKLWNWRP